MIFRESLDAAQASSLARQKSGQSDLAAPGQMGVSSPAFDVGRSAGSAATARQHGEMVNRLRARGPAEAQRALLQLQGRYGKKYVQRVLAAARQPEESEEEEVRAQRQIEEEEQGEELQAQRQGPGEPTVAPEVEGAITRKRGGGQALDTGAQEHIGSALGADFGGVRVHTDAEADTLNRSLDARAFTTGQDIFFRQGEYNPGTTSGQELLAHELTHVVQQGGGGVQRQSSRAQRLCDECGDDLKAEENTGQAIQAKMTVGAPDDPAEEEADEVARQIVRQSSLRSTTTACSKSVSGMQEDKPTSTERLDNISRTRHVQRLKAPLEGWGDVPKFADSSYWNIVPRVRLVQDGVAADPVSAVKYAFAIFKGQRERVNVPLNSKTKLELSADVKVLRDDPLFNNENEWNLKFIWPIRVTDRGEVTISPATPEWEGGAGDVPWALSINPVRDEKSKTVGLLLTLTSTESKSSGHEVNVGVEVGGKKAGGAGGYTYTWGTSTGSTKTAGRGFYVELIVPEPPPPEGKVEIGPVTMKREVAFYFETGKAVLGRHPDTGEDMNKNLTRFLHSLDFSENDGKNISAVVQGFASSLGDTEKNRALAEKRAKYIKKRFKETLPRSTCDAGWVGEDLWENISDVDDRQKHRVAILKYSITSEI